MSLKAILIIFIVSVILVMIIGNMFIQTTPKKLRYKRNSEAEDYYNDNYNNIKKKIDENKKTNDVQVMKTTSIVKNNSTLTNEIALTSKTSSNKNVIKKPIKFKTKKIGFLLIFLGILAFIATGVYVYLSQTSTDSKILNILDYIKHHDYFMAIPYLSFLTILGSLLYGFGSSAFFFSMLAIDVVVRKYAGKTAIVKKFLIDASGYNVVLKWMIDNFFVSISILIGLVILFIIMRITIKKEM